MEDLSEGEYQLMQGLIDDLSDQDVTPLEFQVAELEKSVEEIRRSLFEIRRALLVKGMNL